MKAGAAKNIPTKFSVFMRGFQNSNSDNFEMKYERKYLIYDVNTFSLKEPFYILAAAISNWNLAQEKKFFFLDEKAHFDQIIFSMKKAPTVETCWILFVLIFVWEVKLQCALQSCFIGNHTEIFQISVSNRTV